MALHVIAPNATIKSIKAGELNRLTDGAVLYFRLFVNGGANGWRIECSLNGRRNTLSLGTHPPTGPDLASERPTAGSVTSRP